MTRADRGEWALSDSDLRTFRELAAGRLPFHIGRRRLQASARRRRAAWPAEDLAYFLELARPSAP